MKKKDNTNTPEELRAQIVTAKMAMATRKSKDTNIVKKLKISLARGLTHANA